MGTKSAWTEERRARQREIIRQTQPWRFSTGPRTAAGKAVSSGNAKMSPMRAAEHGLKRFGVLDRRLLRMVQFFSLYEEMEVTEEGNIDFPNAPPDARARLHELQSERDKMAAHILAQFPEKYLTDDFEVWLD